MTLRKVSATLICAAASLLSQYGAPVCLAAAFAPDPPQAPSGSPPNGAAPASPAAPQAAGADDALVAPIALYPDPLIAIILPASTVPGDITAAASYLIQFGDMTRIDGQPWDPSVRALAHYPTVLAWMAENLAWTQALGSAFLSSPADVMEAVQRLRARARAAGTLASTPQQEVYSDGDEIEIYPAQPDSIYVPVYDDSVVFSDGDYAGYGGPFVNFAGPYAAGIWLSYYFDWGRHRVWTGDQNVWRRHNGWQPPPTGGDRSPPGGHLWHPPAPGPGSFRPINPGGGNAVPRPMPGAPNPPPEPFRRLAVQPGQRDPSSSHPPSLDAGAPRPGEVHVAAPPPPPAPVRVYASAPARASEPSAPHTESAHVSAPASAPDSGGRQTQK